MTKPKFAPGPYNTVDVGAGTGFHAYIVDVSGRKIGVAWGPHDEKVWTAALFAASLELFAYVRKCADSGCDEAKALVTKVDPPEH